MNHPASKSTHPHALDVIERETADNGFSAGWGLHMQPSVRYWLDCHTHMVESQAADVLQVVRDWHDYMWAFRLRRHVAVDGFPKNADAFAAAGKADDRFLWLCRLNFDEPDLQHVERCAALGAVGLKLHNSGVITTGTQPDCWQSEAWHRIYERCGQLGLPILWHVTQRLTAAPYTGGGENSYWAKGRPLGANYTNEDLLQNFLSIVARHRMTTFIGAHQIHLGPERLAELFAQHPNLVTDTSIGCYVAPDDVMYEADRLRWREFVIAHADRILFGSDVIMNRQHVNTELLRQHFLGHVRWVKQLGLPQEVLSKVAHENFERIAGLSPVPLLYWGGLRP